jgi:hypothetical protein
MRPALTSGDAAQAHGNDKRIAKKEGDMNRSLRCLTLSLVGLAMVLAPHLAAAGNAPLVADAYTYSAQPTKNFGAKTSLLVQGPPAKPSVGVAYLQFDLSTLPASTSGSDVAKATLTLGVNKVTVPGAFDVFRVLGSPDAWSESGLTDSASLPLAGTAEVSGVPVASMDKNNFKTIDITQLVKDWLDGVLPNNGLALVPNAAGVAAQFDSKESTTTSHYAQLDITLATVTNFGGSLNGDVTGTQTATHVGKINGSLLGSLAGATNGQALTFGGSNWSPSSVVNSVTAGSGVSVSGSTGNVTLSVPASGVSNSMLANSGVTVTAGSGLSGGGGVALGGSTTLTNSGVLSVGASAPLSSSGGQNPSVSLSGTVPVANGGTGASTASAARGNLGAAASGANSDIISLSGASDPNGNTAVGSGAMILNTTGFSNTAVGNLALWHNTAMGKYALQWNYTGNDNTAVGLSALDSNTASGNTAVGEAASQVNQTGSGNTAVGMSALQFNTGSNNIGVGQGASSALTTGNGNIDIGNGGVTAEANTIRIGTAGTQTTTYIAGINGSTVNGSGVAVDANGRLGTAPASVLGLCVPNPAASPQFVDNGDGTVTDLTTCLMWEQQTGTVGGSTDSTNPENVNNLYT